MLILFPPALGKNFFTSTLTSANRCSSQGRGLTPYLHPPWPWMELSWAEFPVTNTWVSQLALTCHGLLILQIAATRHVDLLDFSTGAFIDIQTVPVYWGYIYKSFISPQLAWLCIYCLESSSQGWNWISGKFALQVTAQSCQSSTPAQEMSSIINTGQLLHTSSCNIPMEC